MTDLHAAIGAALDREQGQHRKVSQDGGHGGPGFCPRCTDALSDWVLWPCLPTRRVEADRRVLARHEAVGWERCDHCERDYPCGDVLDLAARYDVETSR